MSKVDVQEALDKTWMSTVDLRDILTSVVDAYGARMSTVDVYEALTSMMWRH